RAARPLGIGRREPPVLAAREEGVRRCAGGAAREERVAVAEGVEAVRVHTERQVEVEVGCALLASDERLELRREPPLRVEVTVEDLELASRERAAGVGRRRGPGAPVAS